MKTMLVNGTPAIADIKNQCTLVHGLEFNYIVYKGKVLWSTISETLDDYFIYLYDGPNYKNGWDPYTVACVDEHGDLFYFGRWTKLKNALAWLEDPNMPERD